MNLDNKINYTYSKCGIRVGVEIEIRENKNNNTKIKPTKKKYTTTGARRFSIDKSRAPVVTQNLAAIYINKIGYGGYTLHMPFKTRESSHRLITFLIIINIIHYACLGRREGCLVTILHLRKFLALLYLACEMGVIEVFREYYIVLNLIIIDEILVIGCLKDSSATNLSQKGR